MFSFIWSNAHKPTVVIALLGAIKPVSMLSSGTGINLCIPPFHTSLSMEKMIPIVGILNMHFIVTEPCIQIKPCLR